MGPDEDADPAHFESVIAQALEAGIIQDAVVAQSQREALDLWAVRDSPAEWRRAGHWPQMSFDVSVPTGEIGNLVGRIREVMGARWPELCTIYFGHVADGNLHLSVRVTDEAGLTERIEAAVYGAVSEHHGSISAEHGIGSLKKDYLHLSRSREEIALMRTLKRAMDPNGILNPGKIF